MKCSRRVRGAGSAAMVVLAVAGVSSCSTEPDLMFSGHWVAQIPMGSEILFTAQQAGSTVTGTVSNFGPVSTSNSPLTGSVIDGVVTLEFSYPAGTSRGLGQAPVAWTYHGQFMSSARVTGTIVSATGITGMMIITQDNGPLPLAAAREREVAQTRF